MSLSVIEGQTFGQFNQSISRFMDIAYCIRISPGRSTAGVWIRTRVNNVFQLLNGDVTTTPTALRLVKISNLSTLLEKEEK